MKPFLERVTPKVRGQLKCFLNNASHCSLVCMCPEAEDHNYVKTSEHKKAGLQRWYFCIHVLDKIKWGHSVIAGVNSHTWEDCKFENAVTMLKACSTPTNPQ